MEPIAQHRVAVVAPFTQFLASVGAPFERGFRKVGLPVCALEDENNFIPSHRFWRFLVEMSFNQDIPDLGFRVGQKYGANCVDSRLTDLLFQSPTLYQGIVKSSALINKTVSNCQVGLLQPSNSQYSYFFHQPSCSANNPAIEQIGWYGIFPFIGIARMFLGAEWLPEEIGVMVNHPPSSFVSEQFPDTYIRLAQPYCYIALKNTQLSLPPLSHQSIATRYPASPHAALSTDFVGSIKKLVRSYISEENLNLELVAEICEMSQRSLQRRLAESSTHFTELLDYARFDLSKQMLQDANNNITDISQVLRYSDATHFARAFRRIAGISPHLYRQQFLN